MKKYGVYHTEIYAMGETYISSVMDTLIAQAFYNNALISVLDQVIVGNSSGGNDLEENCNLFPLRVPTTYIGRTFSELFNYLCEKKAIIALGLYRYAEQATTKPYIVTNPPEDLALTDRDLVFVLSKAMLNFEVTDKWGSPLEDDMDDQATGMAHNSIFKKLHQRPDLESGPDFEVNDYLDKLNVENKRRKELKDNADVVKKLKKRCEDITNRIGTLGTTIANRSNDLQSAIGVALRTIPIKNLKKQPLKTSSNNKEYAEDDENDSESS